MTAAPISAADREKAKELLAASPMIAFENYGGGWTRFDFRHWPAVKAALDAAPAYEARVVELEAALAQAQAIEQELQSRISQLSREKDVAIQFWKSAGINTTAAANARADTSEARATALLEALTPFAALLDKARALKAKMVLGQYLTLCAETIIWGGEHDIRLADIERAAALAAINAGASNDRK